MTTDAFDPAHVKQTLQARLEALKAVDSGAAESRRAVQLDQSSVGRLSRVDAMQIQAMAQATERQRRHEMFRIVEALERLDRGEYGTCIPCGEEIAPRRLAADPTVGTCIRCASGKR